MAGLKLYGRTERAETTGAQLLNIVSRKSTYFAIDVADNVITLKRNEGVEQFNNFQYDVTIPEDGAYTLQIDSLEGDFLKGNIVRLRNSTGDKALNLSNDLLKVTDTLPAGEYIVVVYLGYTTPGTAKIIGLRLTKDENAKWEPYTGGQPSPSPEYPQEMENAGGRGKITVTVSGDGQEEQVLTLATPNGLPGIPVESGGNYADESGQQWVCDEIDFERGKYIRYINELVIDGEERYFEVAEEYWNIKPTGIPKAKEVSLQQAITLSNTFQRILYNPDVSFFYLTNPQFSYINADALNERLRELYDNGTPAKILYVLDQPVEMDLDPGIIAAYSKIHTNYPTTIIATTSAPQAGLEVSYWADSKNYITQKYVANTDFDTLEKRVEALESAALN